MTNRKINRRYRNKSRRGRLEAIRAKVNLISSAPDAMIQQNIRRLSINRIQANLNTIEGFDELIDSVTPTDSQESRINRHPSNSLGINSRVINSQQLIRELTALRSKQNSEKLKLNTSENLTVEEVESNNKKIVRYFIKNGETDIAQYLSSLMKRTKASKISQVSPNEEYIKQLSQANERIYRELEKLNKQRTEQNNKIKQLRNKSRRRNYEDNSLEDNISSSRSFGGGANGFESFEKPILLLLGGLIFRKILKPLTKLFSKFSGTIIKKIFSKFGSLFRKIMPFFSFVKNKIKSLFKLVGGLTSTLAKIGKAVLKGPVKAATKLLSGAAKGTVNAVKSLKNNAMIKKLDSVKRVIADMSSKAKGKIAAKAGQAVAGASKAAKNLIAGSAKLVGKTTLKTIPVLGWAVTAGDAIWGAVDGASQASEMYGNSENKSTFSQKVMSGLSGAIENLTFGIVDKKDMLAVTDKFWDARPEDVISIMKRASMFVEFHDIDGKENVVKDYSYLSNLNLQDLQTLLKAGRWSQKDSERIRDLIRIKNGVNQNFAEAAIFNSVAGNNSSIKDSSGKVRMIDNSGGSAVNGIFINKGSFDKGKMFQTETSSNTYSILDQAKVYADAGVKYSYGAKNIDKGSVDCSGLMTKIFGKYVDDLRIKKLISPEDQVKIKNMITTNAAGIIKNISSSGGGYYQGSTNIFKNLKDGMIIGEADMGKSNITHISCVIKDKGGNFNFIESASGKNNSGVMILGFDQWLARRTKGGKVKPLFATNFFDFLKVFTEYDAVSNNDVNNSVDAQSFDVTGTVIKSNNVVKPQTDFTKDEQSNIKDLLQKWDADDAEGISYDVSSILKETEIKFAEEAIKSLDIDFFDKNGDALSKKKEDAIRSITTYISNVVNDQIKPQNYIFNSFNNGNALKTLNEYKETIKLTKQRDKFQMEIDRLVNAYPSMKSRPDTSYFNVKWEESFWRQSKYDKIAKTRLKNINRAFNDDKINGAVEASSSTKDIKDLDYVELNPMRNGLASAVLDATNKERAHLGDNSSSNGNNNNNKDNDPKSQLGAPGTIDAKQNKKGDNTIKAVSEITNESAKLATPVIINKQIGGGDTNITNNNSGKKDKPNPNNYGSLGDFFMAGNVKN